MDEIVSIDTNVLVRFLVHDEDALEQCEAAKRVFSGQTFLPESVLLETEWVLRAVYSIPRNEIGEAFQKLLRLQDVSMPDKKILRHVMDLYDQGFDFGDALHLLRSQGYAMKTFDRDFSKKARTRGFSVSAP